ncbi:MAG TPA: SIR2 family protein [Phycisphaerae bacterium]|nr:SIR2 family protein [Phycisphaerae bacterium]
MIASSKVPEGNTPVVGFASLREALARVPAVLWIGACFSRSATQGYAPLMRDFFNKIDESRFPHLVAFLKHRYCNIETANVEEILRIVDQIQDSPLSAETRRDLMANQDPRKIKSELLQYCMIRLDVPSVPLTWAAKLLACATEKTTIVTTNYDTVAEQILTNRVAARHCGTEATCHHCNMMAILRENCSCEPGAAGWKPKNAALLKLHGSLCWHVCKNDVCVSANCLVPVCDCTIPKAPKCACCNEENEPVIVLPSMQKSFKTYPQIQRMWDFANTALKSMKVFLIFGFSFPDSDCLIYHLVQSAITNSTILEQILVIDVNTAAVASKLRCMLAGKRVAINELAVPLDGSDRGWCAGWADGVDLNVKIMTG